MFSKLIDAKLTIEAGKSSDQNSTERRIVVQLHFNKTIRDRSSGRQKLALTRSFDCPMTSRVWDVYIQYNYNMNMSVKEKGILALLLNLTMFPQEELPSPNSDVFLHIKPVANVDLCLPQGKLQKRRSGRFRKRRLQPSHLGILKKDLLKSYGCSPSRTGWNMVFKPTFYGNFDGRFTVSWKKPSF